jgi:putative membrane protein
MKTNNQIQSISSVRTSVIKRSGAVLLSAFCLLGLVSCDRDDDEPIVSTVSQQDRNFAISSSQFVNAQLAFSQLAKERGDDNLILEYGEMIFEENTATKSELTGILDTNKVEMSNEITTDMQVKYDELALLQGTAFDKAFIDLQVTELDKSISMFENQINNGENFTIKGFADKTLAAVKSNRNRAFIVKTKVDIKNI